MMGAAYDNNGSRVQVIHFLSCGKHLGSANSIAVTRTTKKVTLLSEAVTRRIF